MTGATTNLGIRSHHWRKTSRNIHALQQMQRWQPVGDHPENEVHSMVIGVLTGGKSKH